MRDTLRIKPIRLKKINYATFRGGINVDIDENLTPVKYSKCTYNFDYSSGRLVDGIGVDTLKVKYSDLNGGYYKEITFPTGVHPVSVCCFKQDSVLDLTELVFFCSDGKLYYSYILSSQSAANVLDNHVFTSTPEFFSYKLNGQNCLIIVSKTDGMWVSTGLTFYKVDNAPNITSFCLHYERLFVTTSDDTHTLWFSDDLDPTNWNVSTTEAGFIELRDGGGELLKVISFHDYVYIFKEYGISRLTAYAKQEEFDLTNLFVSSGKIYKDSIALCGDRILFLASDGLYQFDGANTYKINFNMDKMFDGVNNTTCKSAFFDGNYYLACKLKFDGVEDSAIIRITIANGNLAISKGIDVKYLASINYPVIEKLIAIVASGSSVVCGQVSNSGKFLGVATNKYWRSPSTDFGMPYRTKTLKELYFDSIGQVQIYVNVDGKTYTYSNIPTTKGLKRLKLNLRGTVVSVDFASNSSGVYISNPQLVIGY